MTSHTPTVHPMPQVATHTGAGTAGSILMDGTWWLAEDPENLGRAERWGQHPPADRARPTEVPSALQETLPGFHGVVWYWREFHAPRHVTADGRYLIRFTAVDYAASIWVNGVSVGEHEGGESPFMLDVTDVVRPANRNSVVVRVVNPTPAGIDGLRLDELAHRNRRVPFVPGASWNLGGITGSVSLCLVPQLRIDDLWVRARPDSAEVNVIVELHNASEQAIEGEMALAIAPASTGYTLARTQVPVQLEAETSATVELVCGVDGLERWDLDHPALYRATATLTTRDGGYAEASTRFGIRDFRVRDGAFELNGRRLFLRMTHTVNDYPLIADPLATRTFLRRDIVHIKTLGFTMIRFIWGAATPEQLDLCDELGMLVYSESFAAWPISVSPQMADRFSAAVEGVIRRDRNHPSVVIWGLLNESSDLPAFQHAVDLLPHLEPLDGTRMVALNSGRFDRRGDIASFANPGSTMWDVRLGSEGSGTPAGEDTGWPPTDERPMGTAAGFGDVHIYPRVPHTSATIRQLRDLGKGNRQPIFLSEYGIGSAVDLWRVVRQYEQYGGSSADDAVFYRAQLDKFLADWARWGFDGVFGHPAEFFAASVARNGPERVRGIDALRANPYVIGYGLTGAVDQVMCGEGLATTFRELKAGTADAIIGAFAASRWCVFADAEVVYSGAPVRFEVILATDGGLPEEHLPVLAQLFDPDSNKIWRHESALSISADSARARPMSHPVLDETVHLTGRAGEYTFRIGFERGSAPTGGVAEVLVVAPVCKPKGPSCTIVGSNNHTSLVLDLLGPSTRIWDGGPLDPARPVIWWHDQSADESAAGLAACRRLVTEGGTVICLSVHTYMQLASAVEGGAQLDRGEASTLYSWLYLRDDWARRHPAFAGLQAGGLLDYAMYRELISDEVFRPGPSDVTAIAGAIKASQGYDSALTMWERHFGSGRLIGSTFRLRELVGQHPIADRLLVNLAIHAALPVTG